MTSGDISAVADRYVPCRRQAHRCHTTSIRFADGVALDFKLGSKRDEDNCARLRALLDGPQAPFGRSTATGHVTATAFVVDAARCATLLVHHKKLDLWLPPGGHCDGDGDVRRVALREAREETGLRSVKLLDDAVFDIDIHAIPANRMDAAHLHFDVRLLCGADRDEPLTGSDETWELKWVPLRDLTAFTSLFSILVLNEKLAPS